MTSAQTTTISVPIDKDVAERAESLFDELGMSMSTAINVFIRQSLREGGFPFDITACKPNRQTIEAMLEGERLASDPNAKGFNNVDDLFAELDK